MIPTLNGSDLLEMLYQERSLNQITGFLTTISKIECKTVTLKL